MYPFCLLKDDSNTYCSISPQVRHSDQPVYLNESFLILFKVNLISNIFSQPLDNDKTWNNLVKSLNGLVKLSTVIVNVIDYREGDIKNPKYPFMNTKLDTKTEKGYQTSDT